MCRMIEEFISHTFAMRNASHLAHWATKSYAEHVALGDLYDGLIDKIDGIVEAYQGQFGLVGDVRIVSVSPKGIKAHIKTEMKWLETNRDKIAKKATMIQNMIDDLLALYSTTLYKLDNLA